MLSMNSEIRFSIRRRQGGQTIIVAMIILGLLLIIGFVFIGIVNRNVRTSGTLRDRSIAVDLSEAGIRYAHAQMLRSELGADWRGTPTPPAPGSSADLSLDPDAFYLREPAFLQNGQRAHFIPGANTPFDLGGPDGLGPYFRVTFSNGRALVRVRYAQSDANLFRAQPLGALRNPGLARNYIIIESVGREGKINVNDPTTLTSRTERRIQNYPSAAAFDQEMNAFREAEAHFGGIQVNRAFASIGIIEHARFISNKFRDSRPVELGIPSDLGVRNRNDVATVASRLRYQVGSVFPALTIANGANASVPTANLPGGGSMHVNGDLKLYGQTQLNLNASLGDMVTVAGDISTDEPGARLILNVSRLDATNTWTSPGGVPLLPDQFSSQSSNFQTLGVLRDGYPELDIANQPRGVGYKAPPSILVRDPQTGASRYVEMSRDSGAQAGTGNSGRYGYGRNVYVANGASRQMPVDASAAAIAGGETSLVNEWLSPGGNPSSTGWRGWLYAPPGAYMELLKDGFTIQLDGKSDQEKTWRLPNGLFPSQAGLQDRDTIRYRIGAGSDRRLHIVNTYTDWTGTGGFNTNRIDGALTPNDYLAGPEFGGVVYFEGNVRVRGVIPTDVQLSVVSNATVYIEGSITKGVQPNDVSHWNVAQASRPGRLNRLSRSMLMLMAKDYVALNTTQFFGSVRGQNVVTKEDADTVGSFNPIVMRAGDANGLRMTADMVLDPNGPTASPTDPSTWRPFNADYFVPGSPASPLKTNLLLSHTMDNGAAPASFLTLDVNSDLGGSSYLFPGTNTTTPVPFNNLASEYLPGTNIGVYGLGGEMFERYAQFESVAIPIIDPNLLTADVNNNRIVSTGPTGSYSLLQTGLNDLRFRPTSVGGLSINDYLIGRIALAPNDVRIEASIYAEEGSFFVIPGPWFNPNPNDTFANWNRVDDQTNAALSDDEKNLRRYQTFGTYPEMPFYGEPIDVKINIVGAVSENMPVPMSVQAEWLRKWGWIPRTHGSSGVSIPASHARDTDLSAQNFVPNLTITYDPVLATGRLNGFANSNNPDDPNSPILRVDSNMRPLPPLPRLPVSPTLAFFGEVR
jgi:hypothetical protein